MVGDRALDHAPLAICAVVARGIESPLVTVAPVLPVKWNLIRLDNSLEDDQVEPWENIIQRNTVGPEYRPYSCGHRCAVCHRSLLTSVHHSVCCHGINILNSICTKGPASQLAFLILAYSLLYIPIICISKGEITQTSGLGQCQKIM